MWCDVGESSSLFIVSCCGCRLLKSWITSSTVHRRNTRPSGTWPFSSSSATSISEKWDARRSIPPLLRTWSNPFKLWFSVSNLYLPNERAKRSLPIQFICSLVPTTVFRYFWFSFFCDKKKARTRGNKRKFTILNQYYFKTYRAYSPTNIDWKHMLTIPSRNLFFFFSNPIL